MISILHQLYSKIKEQPDTLLFAFLNIKGETKESYTYQSFLYRTNDIASHIYAKNLSPGDRVLLAYPPGLEMICAFFACVRLGLVPVPVYPPSLNDFEISAQKMNFIAKDCDASAVLTDRTYHWAIKLQLTNLGTSAISREANHIAQLEWIVSDDANTSGEKKFEARHSTLLFLQYTSGSTNEPKGVMVTHENILDNFKNVVDHLPIGVSWLPQYHDMGLIGYYIFFALRGGTTYGFSPTDFILKPSLWLETISKYKASATSAPNFAYEYCLSPGKISEETLSQLDLSSLRFTMTAAEPVNAQIYSDFIKKFKPYGLKPESMFAAYGLAENTLAVTNYGRKYLAFDAELLRKNTAKISTTETNQQLLMSCGISLGDTEVKIVNISETPKEVEDGTVGEIWISGSSRCLGYWNKPTLTKEKFEAQLATTGNTNWLRSGDLGFMFDNELYVCGRLKDMIIIRGLNYYPHDIELIIEQDNQVRKGCVAAFSYLNQGHETLALVVGIKNIKKIPNAHELNAKLVNNLGISATTIVFVPARTVAKTSSGKIKRFENKNRFLNKEFQIIESITIDENSKNNLQQKRATTSIENSSEEQKLFMRYQLTGIETEPLGKAGLDSLKLAEFGHDLRLLVKQKGYEDLSQEIDLRIIQKMAVSELFKIVSGLGTSSPLSKFKFQKALQHINQEFIVSEMALMQNDAQCTIPITQHPNSTKNEQEEGAIFLTGGTGFFGPFLIKSLLEQNTQHIYVLVRDINEDAALLRLIESFSLIDNAVDYKEAFQNRVHVLCGDLSKSKLGLSTQNWDFICNHVAVVYHNGALVNYLLNYESMRNANVGGTNDIVRLCTQSRNKVLNYISTTFIFGWSTKDTLFESDANHNMAHLDFGYSQSKWVAEKIIIEAMKQGLEARIFRPALISPSLAGAGYNMDISIRLMAFMAKYGIGTTAKNQVSYTPADIGANNIVAIANIPESIGKTFHVTRDEFSSMVDITSILSTLMGKPFKNYALNDFVPEVVQLCTKQDPLFPLLNFLVRSVDNINAMEFKRYDNSNFIHYRNQSKWGIQDNSLQEVVLGIFKFMEKQNLVEPNSITL